MKVEKLECRYAVRYKGTREPECKCASCWITWLGNVVEARTKDIELNIAMIDKLNKRITELEQTNEHKTAAQFGKWPKKSPYEPRKTPRR